MTRKEWVAAAAVVTLGIVFQIPGHDDAAMDAMGHGEHEESMHMDGPAGGSGAGTREAMPQSPAHDAAGEHMGRRTVILDVTGMT